MNGLMNSNKITMSIMKIIWLRGLGSLPVTWSTLVDVLEETNAELAKSLKFR